MQDGRRQMTDGKEDDVGVGALGRGVRAGG